MVNDNESGNRTRATLLGGNTHSNDKIKDINEMNSKAFNLVIKMLITNSEESNLVEC